MNPIFLVWGRTGEYDSVREWFVCYFLLKVEADKRCAILNSEVEEWKKFMDWGVKLTHDENFEFDQETKYAVCSIPHGHFMKKVIKNHGKS